MSNRNTKDDMMDNVVHGLESTPVSSDEAREILATIGYDVDKELADFKGRLLRKIKSHTWKAEADDKIRKYHGKSSGRDWRNASDDDIDAAYAALQHTEYKMAARNFEELTRDEKIAILQDVEFLDEEPEKGDS